MKAAPDAQARLLDLAAVDAELARAAHRRETLPEQAEVEQAERAVRAGRDAVVVSETSVTDLSRDVGRLDREVEQVRAREARDRDLIDSGSVAAKQMSDLEHELETLGRRRGVLEDEQLEVMERQEAAQADLVHEKGALDEAEKTLADAVQRRDGALGDIEVLETRRGQEREGIVAELPADLVALYDQVRARSGTGAGELAGARCEACRLEMDRSELGRITAAPADEVVRCENCTAIVVRRSRNGSQGR